MTTTSLLDRTGQGVQFSTDLEASRERGPAPSERIPSVSETDSERHERLARAAADAFQFIWRLLRRLGVRPDPAVDDAVQRVFEIAARKVERVAAGTERAFFYKTAVLVAAEERRRQKRTLEREAEESALELESGELDPEAALEMCRNRERLDEVLDSLPEKMRHVFVLYELEGLSTTEIAALLEVPEGTVASRLRRGRERFSAAARRMRARLSRSNP
jgi:RNA polymerase sigma-70 factor (ECF subfamily)